MALLSKQCVYGQLTLVADQVLPLKSRTVLLTIHLTSQTFQCVTNVTVLVGTTNFYLFITSLKEKSIDISSNEF